MTGELKKGRYVYCHCTGERNGKCTRPYVSKSMIDDAFTSLLARLIVPNEMLGWIEAGLRESDKDRHTKRESRGRSIKRFDIGWQGGTREWALEEIVAELSAAFLGSEIGIAE